MGLHAATYENAALDARMFEATRAECGVLVDRYLENRREWQPSGLIDPQTNEPFEDQLGYMYSGRSELEIPRVLRDSVEVAIITEAGIPWYSGDVHDIFNPDNKNPDSGDPHAIFSHTWPADELPHTYGARDIVRLTGADMVQLDKDIRAFVVKGDVPKPTDTAHGWAYTSIQERLTHINYRNMNALAKPTLEAATTDGREAAAMIMRYFRAFYRKVAHDERLHENVIAGNVDAALHSGDKIVSTHMLEAIHRAYVTEQFAMPGDSMPNYLRRAVRIAKAGILTQADITQSKFDLGITRWRVDKLTGLSGRGQELQERITTHLQSLVKREVSVESDTAAA